jgi:hypothetical protein
MKVITTTKATTAGTAAAIAEGFLWRINVHFNLAVPPFAQYIFVFNIVRKLDTGCLSRNAHLQVRSMLHQPNRRNAGTTARSGSKVGRRRRLACATFTESDDRDRLTTSLLGTPKNGADDQHTGLALGVIRCLMDRYSR